MTNERFDDDEVSALWETPFGAALFNAYTLQRGVGSDFVFSLRLSVVRMMLRAMLDEEARILNERTESSRTDDAVGQRGESPI